MWYSLEEEAEQLKILHNIMLNLQPFKASQAKLFTANLLDTLVKDCQVKTDEQRASETSGTGRRRRFTLVFFPLSLFSMIDSEFFPRVCPPSRAHRPWRDEDAGVAAARDHGQI